MEEKSKDILKQGMMETKSDFTSSIMDQINAEEEALSTVLSEQGVMKPSLDFTTNLMAQLEGKVPAKTYAPIISKRTWIFITAACIALTIFVLSTAQQGSSQAFEYLNTLDLSSKVSSVFKGSYGLLYIAFGVLVLSIGLTIEQRFGKKINP
ncbi:MAG: hypothetical protein ACJASQ_001479 [Crocinitomicaceae bacterium]|jgi:hypothetical protein